MATAGAPAHARPARHQRRGRVRRALFDGDGGNWLLALPFAFLLVFLALPLIATVVTAFSELGAGGFVDAVTSEAFVDAVRRTAIMALIVTAICWPLSVAYCIAMVVFPRPVRIFLLGTLLLTFWISILVRSYGWVLLIQPAGAIDQILSSLGLIDDPLLWLGTARALYPGMVHVMLPFMVLPMFAALLDLDPRQVRAAQSLGAGPLRVLLTVVLPAMRQGTVAGWTLVFIISLGFFITPAFLGGPDAQTIATLIDRQFRVVFDTGSAAAMGTVLIVFVLLFYALLTRLFKVNIKVGAD